MIAVRVERFELYPWPPSPFSPCNPVEIFTLLSIPHRPKLAARIDAGFRAAHAGFAYLVSRCRP